MLKRQRKSERKLILSFTTKIINRTLWEDVVKSPSITGKINDPCLIHPERLIKPIEPCNV